MKVAFIVTRLVNQGPILVVRDLVAGLKSRGVDCSVFYFDEAKEISMGCEERKISFWENLCFQEYDVVHSHGFRPDAYVYWHRSKMKHCKCITTMHNYMQIDLAYQYSRFVSFIFSPVWLFLLRRHDIVVTLSKHALDYYKRWLPEKKLAYVYNAKTIDKSLNLNEQERGRLLQFRGDRRLIGVNALLTRRKGVDQLIKALTFLPDYALVIVGDGQERVNLECLAKQEGVKERCLFLGYQLNAYRYLSYYDIYGMVSRSEGFPLSLIEAAAYGVPTVCSRIPIFEEVFADNEVAFFTLEDISSLKNAILNTNKDMGNKFYAAYNERYTLDKMAQRYLDLYCNKL